MTVVAMTQRLNKTKYITTIYYKPLSLDEQEDMTAFMEHPEDSLFKL